MYRKPGHTHIGQCSQGTVTREQAEAKLRELGFTFHPESIEWKRGDTRGRLSMTPDYCNPDNTNVGTAFALRLPGPPGRELPIIEA